MTYVQKNCKACGDLIEVRLADHKRGWGNFCDKACSAAYKCKQRPKDVNAFHATFSEWAKDRMEAFSKYPNGTPPKAPSIESQVGKVKVKPKHHSPVKSKYKKEDDYFIEDDMGWDAHKNDF